MSMEKKIRHLYVVPDLSPLKPGEMTPLELVCSDRWQEFPRVFPHLVERPEPPEIVA